jgi:RNA polymerase sigma-70 factor (ECF subfamily)
MERGSDEDLMARIAKGDEAAFQLLARRHLPPALGLARRILGSQADAEEIVQEGLLRVWINAPRWQPTAAFRTWFYRVLVNLCLNRRRRAPFSPLDAAGDPEDPGPDALAQLESRERARQVGGAIAALPPRQRAAITLTYQEGFDNAQTAEILGTTVSGVETLLVRARRALRAALATDTDEKP